MNTTINQLELVKDWSVKFKQLVNDEPTIPANDICRLRAKIVIEEALELANALGVKVTLIDSNGSSLEVKIDDLDFDNSYTPEPFEIMDATADLKWVTMGTELACGIAGKSNDIFQRVYDSNMSKLWTLEDYEKNSKAAFYNVTCIYCDSQLGQCKLSNCGSIEPRRWLAKDINGKVIKSPSYKAVDLKDLVV